MRLSKIKLLLSAITSILYLVAVSVYCAILLLYLYLKYKWKIFRARRIVLRELKRKGIPEKVRSKVIDVVLPRFSFKKLFSLIRKVTR